MAIGKEASEQEKDEGTATVHASTAASPGMKLQPHTDPCKKRMAKAP